MVINIVWIKDKYQKTTTRKRVCYLSSSKARPQETHADTRGLSETAHALINWKTSISVLSSVSQLWYIPVAQNLIRANNISIVTRWFEQLQCFGCISSCFYWRAMLRNACEIDAGAGRQMGRRVRERDTESGREWETKGRLRHTHTDLPLVLLTSSEKSTRSRGLDSTSRSDDGQSSSMCESDTFAHVIFLPSYHKHQAKETEKSRVSKTECLVFSVQLVNRDKMNYTDL